VLPRHAEHERRGNRLHKAGLMQDSRVEAPGQSVCVYCNAPCRVGRNVCDGCAADLLDGLFVDRLEALKFVCIVVIIGVGLYAVDALRIVFRIALWLHGI